MTATHLSIFLEYRAYLFSVAKRLLGSATDAEDLLQETFLRWQETSLAQIRSPKAFLSTILKRLCLNHLQCAYVRREECAGANLPEPAATSWTSDDRAEGVMPALLILLQRLSPNEQVVLLLRDIFGCDYDEIASMVRKSAVTCRQMLSRARQHLTSGDARFVPSPEKLRRLTKQFAQTCASGDFAGLVSILA